MAVKDTLKKAAIENSNSSTASTSSFSQSKKNGDSLADLTSDNSGPAKKGRKRKNPPLEDTPSSSHGPGRPKKKKGDPSITDPSSPINQYKSKKLGKKVLNELSNGGSDTPVSISSPKVDKALTKQQKIVEKPTKPKKKYQKLTQEEREARKLQKKKATEEAKRLKQLKSKQSSKAKEKPPVDVEKQCGVALDNGGFCARSLTCKTHSMGAKRAVTGRSKPYDILLAAYQKRNQVKLAELSTQQQLEKDNEEFLGAQPLTEEEEISQVMSGVFASKPVPLEQRVVIPIRQKTRFFRMREMLITALNKTPPMSSLISLAHPTLPGQSSSKSAEQVPGSNGQNPEAAAATAANNNKGSTNTTGASFALGPQSNISRPAPPIPHNIGEIMNSTNALYGRALVFDPFSGQEYTRPSQTLFANRIIKHHNAIRQRRLQQMQLEQQQQQARILAQSQNAQTQMQGQLQNQTQMSRSPTNPVFQNPGVGMQRIVTNGYHSK